MKVNRRDFVKLGIAPIFFQGKLVFLIKNNGYRNNVDISFISGDVGDAAYFMEIVLTRINPNWRTSPSCQDWKKYSPLAGYCLAEPAFRNAFKWAVQNSGLKVEVVMENLFSNVKWSEVDIIAVDLFNTVFKLDRPQEEIKAYARHIHQKRWAPLSLPQAWGELDLFEDSEEGLDELAKLAHTVTMSNAPLEVQRSLGCTSLFCELFALENYQVFKPNHKAYRSLCKELKVKPAQVLMVTANEKFGDLEAAREVGMQSIFVDRQSRYGKPRNLVELAKMMGNALRRTEDGLDN